MYRLKLTGIDVAAKVLRCSFDAVLELLFEGYLFFSEWSAYARVNIELEIAGHITFFQFHKVSFDFTHVRIPYIRSGRVALAPIYPTSSQPNSIEVGGGIEACEKKSPYAPCRGHVAVLAHQ